MVKPSQFSVAACAIKVRSASREIQLIPAGPFQGLDGRPHNAPHWRLDVALATQWLAELRQRKTPFVIDYEHQTLRAADNGQPAPAAGTFSAQGLELRDGSLWATDVQWTPAAQAAIEAGEYLYISPVFAYRADGSIVGLLNAALTNTPNIDGMAPVFRAAASQFFDPESPEDEMNKKLRQALGLPENASDDDLLAACTQAVADRDAAVAAADEARQALAANSQQSPPVPDPAQFVSVTVANELRDQVAELSQQINQDKVSSLVNAALDDGRLLPAQKDWATQLGQANLATLSQYLESAEPIVGLRAGQSGGQLPAKGPHGLSEAQLAMCSQAGWNPEEYAKELAAEEAA